MDGVGRREWDSLVGQRYPFLRHEFLAAAEATGCVSPATGWTPRHLLCRNKQGRLLGALPLYEKNHSWGEFVFDWAWAQAYERIGLDYYPRLVSAVPFTPATSPRLLLKKNDPGVAAELIAAAREVADDLDASSIHVQFPLAEEMDLWTGAGYRARKDCQFHWHNRGYAGFDEFLATFSSRKRKKARQDRRRVRDQDIRFRWLDGRELDDALWRDVYQLISLTFLKRGSMPYFDLDFFRALTRRLPDSLLVILALRRGQAIAASVFFRGQRTLYGRYWGADGHYDALHFETCYYQGIDYCIENDIAVFEPGTQGEHKISRGFVPVETRSAHWLRQPQFFDAIGDYLDEEGRRVERYMEIVEAHSPYRRDPDRKD